MIWPLHLSNFTMATHPSAHHAVAHQYVYFLKLSKFFHFYLLLSLTKASHSPHIALSLVPHYLHLSLHLCLQNYQFLSTDVEQIAFPLSHLNTVSVE